MMSLLHIENKEVFQKEVLESDKVALVDFWAPWCGPCKMVAPELEAVASEYEDKAIVAKINVDEQQQLASQYDVMSIPTLLILKDGQEIERLVGYRPRKDLMDAIDKII